MAYNLSPRWKPPLNKTSEFVGPTYYHVTPAQDYRTNGVPFLSSTERKTLGASKLWTTAIYDARNPMRIIGGSSMRNRAVRDTLGIKSEDVVPRMVTCHPSEEPRRPRRLYVCKVPFYGQAKGPSIPSKFDENGYHVNDDGELVKNPPDLGDSTLGPAYYCVQDKPNMSKEMYGGCRWSASSAPRRTIVIPNDNPGPGSYHLGQRERTERELIIDCTREMARALCYLPRFADEMQNRAFKENLPGPGAYNTQPRQNPPRFNPNSAFNVSSKRFAATEDENPSPGEYELGSTLETKWVSRAKNSFVYKMPRFPCHKPSKLITPGPGAYEVKRLPQRTCGLTSSPVPFGISGERMPNTHDDEMPGPSDYAPEDSTPPTQEGNTRSSVFKSRSARFTGVKEKHKCANAATYNISSAFNKNRAKKSFAYNGAGFDSTEKRVLFKIQDGPSPCHRGHTAMPYKGYYLSLSPRFKEYDNGMPGPGTYSLDPICQSSVYKGTHNLRLKENQLGSKLRLPPNKTRAAWNRERRKKRFLKAFHHNEIQIMESWMDL